MKHAILIIALLTTLCAASGEVSGLLDSACKYLDAVGTETLNDLRNLAMGSEARSGKWEIIKPGLAKLGEKRPGVWFYVLPDGNYFSVDRDYTNLNLSDRGYFQSLFAGKEVQGYPVHSRSTGRKSLVFAVPILLEDKTAAALGASIFLDELHAAFSRDISFPEGYTWFVVDVEGNTLLDREPEYMLMNAITQGGESLAGAIRKVVQNQSGSISYDLAGIPREGVFQKLPSLNWWMIIVKREVSDMQIPEKLELSLKQFVAELQTSLKDLDGVMIQILAGPNLTWDSEASIRRTLNECLDKLPYIVDAAFVDSRGVMLHIEPGEYKNFENTDISSQAHVKQMQQSKAPVFSSGFISAEGFPAMSIAYPVFDRQGQFFGAVSLLLQPELLVSSLLKKSRIPDDYELWIMQTDGMIVYDQDAEERGKMLFSDPLYASYASLLELGRKISSFPQGEDHYVFKLAGSDEDVVKTATWDTVKLHGNEWRVVLTQPQK